MKALVIIPTYNEIANIEKMIAAVLSQDPIIDILIIDDNSPDGTAKVVKKVMGDNDRIKLIERSGKLGLGSAYVKGFEYALANGYKYILEMDADFSHNPNDLPRLLEAAK
ncbi:MAG TPA: glycosyltransferase, partial [Candidatus Cloacimonadota bacterium]|nr:glycosyltransferase [Candidatus Cloacimonadota bacterium]